MQTYPVTNFLRYVLFADAATCSLMGLAMAIGMTILSGPTGLPTDLLFYAGIGLFPFVALLVYLATRRGVSPAAIWTVVIINALWTLVSFLLLASGWVTPTPFGYAFVVFQAIGVAGFALLEYLGLRQITSRVSAS
jgi:hypothetical protein